MDRYEFKEWADDLADRMPSMGQWLFGLPQSTRDIWFDDVFSLFELRDALAVNRELMLEGGIAAFERDKLPSIFAKRIQDVSWNRREREESRRHESRNAKGYLLTDAVMGPAYTKVLRRCDEWRQENDAKSTPDEIMRQFVDEAIDEFDKNSSDDLDLERYRCLLCRDTGYVKTIIKGIEYAAGCACHKGAERCNQWSERHRVLGRHQDADSTINVFNEALQEHTNE